MLEAGRSTLPKTPLTPEQYLEIERKAEFKSEFHNGEMFPMSGGSRAHSRLAFRLAVLIGPHLEKKGCEGNTADLRVFVESAGLYTYPDLSVVCGEPRFADSQMDVLLNPGLLVEVLSPTTEQYDRGTKAKIYRTIPSLQELLLISQKTPEIDLYRRENEGNWSIITVQGMESTLDLTSIGYTLRLADLYRGILD